MSEGLCTCFLFSRVTNSRIISLAALSLDRTPCMQVQGEYGPSLTARHACDQQCCQVRVQKTIPHGLASELLLIVRGSPQHQGAAHGGGPAVKATAQRKGASMQQGRATCASDKLSDGGLRNQGTPG